MADTVSSFVRGQLRAEMARRQLSQRDVAAELGVSPMWVSSRLNGRVSIAVDDLALFAQVLDVPVAQFLPAPERAA
jgi:transcriptional regulator with XRE-family HTH domain